MTTYSGLPQILMAVIEGTVHPEGHSNEKRLDDAMTALFGKEYGREHIKPPDGFTHAEILELVRKKAAGIALAHAVRELLAWKAENETVTVKNDGRSQAELENRLSLWS